MASPFKIKGLTELKKKLKNLDDATKQKIDDYLTAKALEIHADATRNAGNVVDNGFLKNGITFNTGTFLSKRVSSNASYSAYVEFGTGPYVNIPPGLEEFARQFYINGKGTTRAQPFLFPAYFKNVRPKKVEKDIKRIIEKG